MSDISAKDFQTPLLRVLGDMTHFLPGIPVKGADTYEPVMALMGIADIEEHGINKASGQPMVAKWIQWANSALRKGGLTENAKRGYWQLTSEGKDKAIEAARKAGTLPSGDDAPESKAPESKGVPLPTVKAKAGVYHEDPYVVSLAIQQTRCFGHFSGHGRAACVDCPLARECRNMWASRLSKIAARLEEARRNPKPKDDKPKAVKPLGKDPSKIDFSDADRIDALMDAVCEVCRGKIASGSPCLWHDTEGLFHIACVEDQ